MCVLHTKAFCEPKNDGGSCVVLFVVVLGDSCVLPRERMNEGMRKDRKLIKSGACWTESFDSSFSVFERVWVEKEESKGKEDGCVWDCFQFLGAWARCIFLKQNRWMKRKRRSALCVFSKRKRKRKRRRGRVSVFKKKEERKKRRGWGWG